MQRRQQKTANTANYSDKPAPNQFAPRPFVVQTQADAATTQQETSDLQVEEVSEKQFGNGLPDASLFTRQFASPPIPRLQMKPDVQRHQEEDEVQMKPDVQRHQEEDEVQMKPDVQRHQEEDEAIQRQVENNGSFDAGINLESRIRSNQSGGQALDAGVRAFMEPRFGHSFAGVRVHTNSESVQMNQELHAQAFTNGQHIYFNEGKYNPGSESGKQLLAHELTHTIQQTGGNELQRQSDSNCGAACQCSNCVPVNPLIQRQISVMRSPDTQNLLNRKLTDVVQAHGMSCPCHNCSTPSVKIQRQTEAKHGSGCSCSMCAGKKGIQTKLTVGAPGDRYEQEADKIAARVIRMPKPQPTASIQRHKEEEIAQTKLETTPKVQQSTTPSLIQRHSSWEHQLLGDVPPNKLAQIGTWQDLLKQTEKKGGFLGFGAKRDKEEAEVNIPEVGTISKGNVMHVIAQELQRLAVWQKSPPQGTSNEDKEQLIGEDSTWNVELVSLPVPDGQDPLIVTYGEMNTLADFYGNLEAMKTADRQSRFQIIQSVRQETFFRLKDIYTQLQKSLTDTEKQDNDVKSAQEMYGDNELVNQKLGYKFQGAILWDYISDGPTGQLDLLSGAQSTGVQDETNKYGGTLARNACHFVPESWHAWAKYHKDAIQAAKNAWDKQQEANDIMAEVDFGSMPEQDSQQEIDAQVQTLNQEAAQFKNEALMSNGFGDHYLQDSYASGHMINKTQIMQWYVEYIDTSQEWDYFTDENWRKVQQMAYLQPDLASAEQYDKSKVEGVDSNQVANKPKNPQGVEDIQADDWQVRFDALGLKVPTALQTSGTPERQLMEWWQTTAAADKAALQQTGADLIKNNPLKDSDILEQALKSLLHDGIIRVDGVPVETLGLWKSGSKDNISLQVSQFGWAESGKGLHVPKGNSSPFTIFHEIKFILRQDYVPKEMEKFNQALEASQNGDDTQYQRMAASVTYGDYFEFMKSGFIQKATNALHDTFCKGGLNVFSGNGQQLFKVYGDDAMFSSSSAEGVKHSAETANMSRDAILNIINNGQENITTSSIISRLPDTVAVDVKDGNGKVIRKENTKLEDWHNPQGGQSLKTMCMKDIFPSMSWGFTQKMVPGIGGKNLGQISKDENVHGGDAF